MTRILLLIPFVIWMSWTQAVDRTHGDFSLPETVLFLGTYVGLILLLGVWARIMARRVSPENLHEKVRRFNRMMTAARAFVPIWFGMGVWQLNWGWTVHFILGPIGSANWQSPGILVGTMPALLAWMGLWWSQFPADIALREQNMLFALDADLPVHAPPRFGRYFFSNLRLQILFLLIPVLLIVLLRDLSTCVMRLAGMQLPLDATLDSIVSITGAALVFLFAPEILRRVLHTEPLPSSPLRDRLEAMCARTGLRYRDILLWRTHSNVANAAVMGLIPQVRYILMSDLLLETMTDAQIESVFAHEAGHIRHRHMLWYVIFFAILLFASVIPSRWIEQQMMARHWDSQWLEGTLAVVGFGIFWFCFGFLSRRFERQADVFAGRTMEAGQTALDQVGVYGAEIFASALRRVAVINNLPIDGRNWTHGSIRTRINYLNIVSNDPIRTTRFDRDMWILKLALLVALLLSATSAFIPA